MEIKLNERNFRVLGRKMFSKYRIFALLSFLCCSRYEKCSFPVYFCWLYLLKGMYLKNKQTNYFTTRVVKKKSVFLKTTVLETEVAN